MIQLYQLKEYDSLTLLTNFTVKLDLYEITAALDTDDLGTAFNMIQDNYLFRSASVGDIFGKGHELYIIKGIGYKKVLWGDVVSLFREQE